MSIADQMGMTDPNEYVYLSTLHNTVDFLRPWKTMSRRRRRDVDKRVFRPVLQVLIRYMHSSMY